MKMIASYENISVRNDSIALMDCRDYLETTFLRKKYHAIEIFECLINIFLFFQCSAS